MSDSKRSYRQIARAVYERPWAIMPHMLAAIEEVVRLRVVGQPFSDEEIDERLEAARTTAGPRAGSQRAQSVAVIPIYGVIQQRMNLMAAMSGGTSVERIRSEFRAAMADPDVGGIVFDVDSPGGTVDGIPELAREIRSRRGEKPMTAVANSTMASAAYWLGSAADELVAGPSAVVGSIGVIGTHIDQTAADEMAGERVTLITAGEGKAVGNPHQPLDDAGLAELQGMADEFYSMFVGDVAASRGVTAKTVRSDWKASAFTAARAKEAGLIDRVDTLDGAIRRMVVAANRSPAGARAIVDAGALSARDSVGVLLASLPHDEQLAVMAEESARLGLASAAAELEDLPFSDPPADEEAEDPGLDTDQPDDEADVTPEARRRRPALELFDAVGRGYRLPPRSEVSNP